MNTELCPEEKQEREVDGTAKNSKSKGVSALAWLVLLKHLPRLCLWV